MAAYKVCNLQNKWRLGVRLNDARIPIIMIIIKPAIILNVCNHFHHILVNNGKSML